MEKGTLMAIPAMLAFDMDQTSGAEVGRIFKSNFNRRGRLLASLASALSYQSLSWPKIATRPPADSRVPGEEEASGYW